MPARFRELAGATDVGPVEAALRKPVERKARLVGDPFLIHLFMEARQDAQHGGPARIDADVGANRVEHVDRFGLAQLPRPRREGIRLRGQGADRTEIDDVGGELGAERLADESVDLHILAAPDAAEISDARDIADESNAAGAMDTAIHAGRDQRAEILIFDRALVLLIAAAIEAIGHRLVLQIAFATLIADRAIERMVDEQELHHALARLASFLALREDDHPVSDRLRAGSDRL